MAIETDLSTDVGQIRMIIGDDTDVTEDDPKEAGILPNGANLQDNQIQFLLDREGGNVNRAVAAAYELLASRFAQAVNLSEGERSESLSKIYDNYAALAKEWRAKWGGEVDDGGLTFAVPLGRSNTATGQTEYAPRA